MAKMTEKWPDERLDELSARVDDLPKSLEVGFDRIDRRFEKVDEEFKAVRSEVKEGFDRVDAKFNKVDARFDWVAERLEALQGAIRLLLITALAGALSIVAAICGAVATQVLGAWG
jgi:chaperonin cofactor prefoldin